MLAELEADGVDTSHMVVCSDCFLFSMALY